MPLLSVVVPVKDERENVRPLFERVRDALDGARCGPWELVFVDDGSTDGTFAELDALATADDRVKVVRLRRNFGQSAATQAGLDAARGDVIVTIDGQQVNYVGQLQQVVGFKPVGQSVHVEVARQGGVRRTYDVRLISGEARTRAQISRADATNDDGTGKDASGNPTAPANTLLGVSVTPLTSALSERLELQNHVEGLVVTDVDPSGPAAEKLFDEAGGSGPDIIVAVNGRAVKTEGELRDALRAVGAGKIASLDIYNARSDARRMERLRLGQ